MEEKMFNITHLGDRAILIQILEEPSHDLLNWLLKKAKQLREALDTEVTHTYNEILIRDWDFENQQPLNIRFQDIRDILGRSIQSDIEQDPVTTHHIPVCYEDKYAPDMKTFTKMVRLSKEEVVALHTQRIYTVYFIGFLPGFPYLLGLDKRLSVSRKSTPMRKVPAGGVAIGGNQTGIYPQESPGGWYIIGRTPVELFHTTIIESSLFRAGDKIKFVTVGESDFLKKNLSHKKS